VLHELRAIIGQHRHQRERKDLAIIQKNSLAAKEAWLWVAQAKANREPPFVIT
jgi:hypothetical protein